MRLFLAIRAFFVVLFRRDVAMQIRKLLDSTTSSTTTPEQPKILDSPAPQIPQKLPASKPGRRNDALTLLSTLQREARLVDLIFESLDDYNDAQIGAAARDVLRDSRKSLARMFGVQHLVGTSEGSTIELPESSSPVRWRIMGKESARLGTLSHAGWHATKVDMPQWSGTPEDEMVIAAAEVET